MFAKAEVPIDVTLPGIMIEIKLVQPENAELLIVSKALLRVTEVRLLQFWKVFPPILVTFSGMVMDVKLVQP